MPLPTGGTASGSGVPGLDGFSASAGASPARILAALQRITGCAAGAAELVRVVADEAGALLHASAAVVSAGSGGLVPRAASGSLAPREGEPLAGEGVCAAALRTGLPASSRDLARDSGGAAPFHDGERAVLSLVAEVAAAAEARIQNESWRRTWYEVLAATGRALFRVELRSGRIEWGGGVGAPEATVESWGRSIAVEEREQVVRALATERASRLEFHAGNGERFRKPEAAFVTEGGGLGVVGGVAPCDARRWELTVTRCLMAR